MMVDFDSEEIYLVRKLLKKKKILRSKKVDEETRASSYLLL